MKNKLRNILDWLISIIGYSLILVTVELLFKKTMYIDNSYYFLWPFIASIIIYVLNKTVKPLIIWLTLPITGITLGLFYPFINVLILKIVSFILKGHFEVKGIFLAFLIAIIISIMNILMEELVLKPLRRK